MTLLTLTTGSKKNIGKNGLTGSLHFNLLLLIFLIFCSSSYAEESLTPIERAYLQNKDSIVFVSQSHYAPFEFVGEAGNRDGMCIELARWIATEFGFKALFVDTSFAKAQQMILNGQADVLTSFFYSEKRDLSFDFTQTMFNIPASIFVAADRPDIKGIEDLNGKVIAIQKGDYAEDFLKEKQINFKVLHAANFSEASDLVVEGKADAIIGDEQIVLYHLYSNNLEKTLKRVGQPLYSGENAMGVVDGNRVLINILNKGISLARDRGVLKSISDKWLGTQLVRSDSLAYKYRWFLLFAVMSILGLLIFVWLWNISLRREVRRRTRILRESEFFLDTVIEHIPNMVFVKNAEDLTFVKFNRAGEQLIGLRREELYGKNDFDLFPEEQAKAFTRYDRTVLEKGQLVDIQKEIIQTRHKGERKLHTQKIAILDDSGHARYLLGISEDITDRLAVEQNLVNALKEKETLLKEVHHRVKNNMQVISSLLDLQMQTIDDDNVIEIFNEARNRIHAMALVHENLYKSESFADISVQDYFNNLTAQLSQLLGGGRVLIRYDIQVDDVTISADEAVPFGLVVTEILTNAIKYAFPQRYNGTVTITLVSREDGRKQLCISDDGVGLPAEMNPQTTNTLGMRLIRDLIEGQLEGSWSVDGRHGVTWTVCWRGSES
ncbi:MAG: transporter substrate-binding domain-containing protein [Desulfuromonadales bacterium]|nr:transporter substrate-binding domain-containing protein [Desulfuromonadales bacterium]MBN2791726.1 transporter substrate-binding domain-containing protein [Desulfuromonadales bacterium]